MLKVAITLAALLAVPGAAFAQTSEAQPPIEKREKRTDASPISAYKIILVGDSTMAPGSGWASVFCAYHVKSNVACLNMGRGGRSTRSYRAEGSWDIALNEAKAGGYAKKYVLIQFGHNDQSTKAERWTDLNTDFQSNLRQMVLDVRAAGAVPVLVTPLSRREFRGGKLNNTLAAWADAVRKIGVETKAPVIELNRDSAKAVEQLGAVESTKLAMAEPLAEEIAAARAGTTLRPRPAPESPPASTLPKTGPRGRTALKFDYTHVGEAGAKVFAKIVAYDLAVAVPELSSQLLP
ncbi:rhamnogalacturonan acetylesterase [Sphingomonas kyeonggiensis]|uniref:Lysophospholipase L1-like esterase n=1 Tax=Sphingomonas kyeonggiensis TaxID=1268553 RepID=A0A7W6JVJ3_9SPHN|nr:rhamnogalacturonan acetylesterase [Sphingomonas kyeonggiensis]MBB4100364.1 lysophospholipase L1-like esterase [Sphingomonas kyeonggiensis]